MEDQAHRIAIAHACSLFGGDDALGYSLFLEAGWVDAGTVVGDVDSDLTGLMVGTQLDRAARILALGRTNFRSLDAVVDGVANQVGQWIADGLDNGLVDFDVLTFEQ